MSVVWKKAWRDLSRNKMRTALAVLSTAVGVFALGFVINMSSMMKDSVHGQSLASRGANIQLYAAPILAEQVESIRGTAGVGGVEAVINSFLRWRRVDETEWRDASLTGRADFENHRGSILAKNEGIWAG